MRGSRLYNTVAEMVRRISATDTGEEMLKAELTEALADAFAADNPGFDRAKFLTACGF